MNLKRKGRERQREKHERIRERRVEGGLGEKEGGERERVKQKGEVRKEIPSGKDEETETNIASQKRHVERKDVDVGWG